MRSLACRIAAALAIGIGVISALPAAGAHADSSTMLPIDGFGQIIADTAHGHLFLSQGRYTDGIAVTDLSGSLVTTLAAQDIVAGMVLSADGSTLYAAMPDASAVAVISTATLQMSTYSLPAGDQPEYLAIQSGRLWVSYNPPGDGAGISGVGDIDLTATTPAFEADPAMGSTWYSAPVLAADPGDSGVLVAGEPDESPSSIAAFTTTTTPVTVRAQIDPLDTCGGISSMAVTAGGADVVVACDGSAAYVFDTTDLDQQGSYPAGGGPDGTGATTAVTDAAGDLAVGSATISDSGADSLDGPDLYTYAAGSTAPANVLALNSAYETSVLQPTGLAWAPDGSAIYGVVEADTGTAYQYFLQVITDPLVTRSTLSLTSPSAAFLGASVSLTGSLGLSTGAPPAGTPVVITRSQAGSTATATFTVDTAADGTFSLSDTPPGLGQYTYAASYAGSADIAAASASSQVTVVKLNTALSLSTGHTTFTYEPVVHLTVHLGQTATSRTVAVYARDFTRHSAVLLHQGRVNSKGNLTLTYRAAHNTTFTVEFAGDARYAARSVSRTVYVKARMSQRITGGYGTTRSSGRTYYLFRTSQTLSAHITVAPDEHRQCVEFEVEEYFDGGWQPIVDTGCAYLSKSSTALLRLTLAGGDLGRPYRVRGDFIPAASEKTIRGNDSSWALFRIES
jgi:hypothetical protein